MSFCKFSVDQLGLFPDLGNAATAIAAACRRPCPAGRFGDAWGLTDPRCSGLCRAGSYCPIGSSKAEEFPCGDPSQYCPEGSALPVLANEGYFTVNGVCKDVWPMELAHFTTFDNFRRRGEPVFTAEQLIDLTAHKSWQPGETWTLQVTASSTCSVDVRFGFAHGGGSLIITIPAHASDITVRVVDELRVAIDPLKTYLTSFDVCENGATVQFHRIRIGRGVCTGYEDATEGICLETRWSETVIFDDGKF